MATFKKAILKAGTTYHSPDGQVPVTSARLKHWQKEFTKLSNNGYVVPIDWDHADNLAGASPIKLSEHKKRRSAKNTVGKLAAFNVATDGQSAEVLLDITDPQAKGRAERNEVYVSPVIFEQWQDGAKNKYSDVITHVDIVNHPVDHSQGPFVAAEPGTLAMGIRMGLSNVYRLGDNPFEKDDEEDKDEDNADGNDEPTDVIPADEATPEIPEASEDKNDDMPKVVGDDKTAVAIVAHLDQLGVSLPADWTFSSDAAEEILLTGLKTALKSKLDAEADQENEDNNDPYGGEMGKVSDPGYAAMSLQARTAYKFAEGQHRDTLKARLEKAFLAGKCSPAQRDALLRELPAIRLSLDSEGKHRPSVVEERLSLLEQNPDGTFWDDKTRTAKMQRLSVSPIQMGVNTEDEAYLRKLAGLK